MQALRDFWGNAFIRFGSNTPSLATLVLGGSTSPKAIVKAAFGEVGPPFDSLEIPRPLAAGMFISRAQLVCSTSRALQSAFAEVFGEGVLVT